MILSVNGVELPAPTEITIDDEIIWSSNTGRVASGEMVGDVIAEKKTLNIKWDVLKESELKVIATNLVSGFFPISFHDNGQDYTIQSYRGTLSKEVIGRLGDGIYWYKSASVKLVQQ